MMKINVKKIAIPLFLMCFSTATFSKSEESVKENDCRNADGYSTNLLAKVAEGVGVPASTVTFKGSFIGGPTGFCTGLFLTPKGPFECAVSAYTTDGGKTYFIGVPPSGHIFGMSNLCRKSR